jgi:hypothetical protein
MISEQQGIVMRLMLPCAGWREGEGEKSDGCLGKDGEHLFYPYLFLYMFLLSLSLFPTLALHSLAASDFYTARRGQS